MLTEDEKIAAVAATLLGSVNAPKREIWKVSRAIVAMVSAEFAGEIERLQKIIDSRPAISDVLDELREAADAKSGWHPPLNTGYYPLHGSDEGNAPPVPGDVLPAPQLVGNVQMWRDKNGQLWRRKRTGPGEWEPWECENTQSTK